MFQQVEAALAEDLHAFWRLHQAAYHAELRRFRLTAQRREPLAQPGRPLRRQTAAVARGGSGQVVGVVLVVLRELNPDLHLGTHAYFQRMYVDPKVRSPRLANQLYKTFLKGFDGAKVERDHRAGVLMSDNINPGLQRSFMRRYFARLGFVMLGSNQLGGEVWSRRLATKFVL
ncbi:hypothetical protein [Cyanobium sp. Morenito 9A2]|uniref:hypothetical protein n=1 Tax=Cyanobium sp. Morenito 9A2 TaxID=2823718 RepID=UPI0020CCF964|nr:hypothetical protein [Cyanobium sp. Morenito 9A2]